MHPINLENIETRELQCKGCINNCTVLRFRFQNGNVSYSGNKCEKVFSSKNSAKTKGYNAFEEKNELLFSPLNPPQGDFGTAEHQSPLRGARGAIGIPRVLNMYENFPFWRTLFEGCGFEVVLSPESTFALYGKGASRVMSDNLCFPAKLAQGHVLALLEMGVDRIFYPIVAKESQENEDACNSFNCPVVSGYPDVIRSAVEPEETFGVPLDKPVITFHDEKALKEQCRAHIEMLYGTQMTQIETQIYADNINEKICENPKNLRHLRAKTFDSAFEKANFVRKTWKNEFIENQQNILNECLENGELCFVVAGRPYHADPLIQQKVGQILSDLGVNVLTDDVFTAPPLVEGARGRWRKLNMVSQWSYPNRVVQAAMEVANLPDNVQLIQLNSFGCGPDSFYMDEIGEILRHAGKNHTVLRIDEIASPGSIRLRCRSLIESLKTKIR